MRSFAAAVTLVISPSLSASACSSSLIRLRPASISSSAPTYTASPSARAASARSATSSESSRRSRKSSTRVVECTLTASTANPVRSRAVAKTRRLTLATAFSGSRLDAVTKSTEKSAAAASSSAPAITLPATKTTIAAASAATARANSASGGAMPKYRGVTATVCTGTRPVSSGGISSTAVASFSTEVRTPHSGQKRPSFGSRAPQLAQLAGGTDLPLGLGLAPTGLQRTQGLRRPPAQRPDELAVVLVGDLAGAMVELELLQGRQRAVALLRELQPAALELIGLAEPVLRGRDPGPPEKRQRDHDDRGDSEHNTEREPDAHAPNASGGSGFGCRRGPPRGHPVAVLFAEAAGRIFGQRVAGALPVGGAHEGRDDLDVPLLDLARLTPEIGEAKVDIELQQVDTARALRHGKSVE